MRATAVVVLLLAASCAGHQEQPRARRTFRYRLDVVANSSRPIPPERLNDLHPNQPLERVQVLHDGRQIADLRLGKSVPTLFAAGEENAPPELTVRAELPCGWRETKAVIKGGSTTMNATASFLDAPSDWVEIAVSPRWSTTRIASSSIRRARDATSTASTAIRAAGLAASATPMGRRTGAGSFTTSPWMTLRSSFRSRRSSSRSRCRKG